MEAPLHIGYTSGKGWDDPAIADLLIDNGLSELSFTVFATDPALRKALHARSNTRGFFNHPRKTVR